MPPPKATVKQICAAELCFCGHNCYLTYPSVPLHHTPPPRITNSADTLHLPKLTNQSQYTSPHSQCQPTRFYSGKRQVYLHPSHTTLFDHHVTCRPARQTPPASALWRSFCQVGRSVGTAGKASAFKVDRGCQEKNNPRRHTK